MPGRCDAAQIQKPRLAPYALAKLLAKQPERYEPGQLRTLERRVREWRAQHGPEKKVFFAQAHVPGEAMQTDFT